MLLTPLLMFPFPDTCCAAVLASPSPRPEYFPPPGQLPFLRLVGLAFLCPHDRQHHDGLLDPRKIAPRPARPHRRKWFIFSLVLNFMILGSSNTSTSFAGSFLAASRTWNSQFRCLSFASSSPAYRFIRFRKSLILWTSTRGEIGGFEVFLRDMVSSSVCSLT